jgi:hypothetical protein
MKEYRLLLAIFSVLMVLNLAHAGYWFQFGARGGGSSEFNQGASLSIQTVTPQNVITGAPAFWLGEDLANGAFLQMGYLVVNQSGSYPSYCVQSGCTQYEDVAAGQAEWFYEYFPQHYSGSNFLGAVGPAGSAGGNDTFNTYGFYYNGTGWNFIFNGNVVGSVDLGSGSSGVHSPVAFGELANASNNKTTINPVIMQNLSVYNNSRFTLVPTGYSYIGFGTGSQENTLVPYGTEELDGRVNYFQVGSGLPILQNGTELWSGGYNLDISSEYGNIASNTKQITYSKVTVHAPKVANISSGKRATFVDWLGSGFGSYSGEANSTTISIEGNISETAQWQLQYYLETSSDYGTSTGTGWYNANASVVYGINSSVIYKNGTARNVFEGWTNGTESNSSELTLSGPIRLDARWQQQYLINATSDYGNVSGGGWKPANVIAMVSVSPRTIQINQTSRLAFYSWSDGEQNSSIAFNLSGPVSVRAGFRKQYLYEIQTLDAYRNRIEAGSLYVNGVQVNSTAYLFRGQRYNVSRVFYNGVWIPVNVSFEVNSSSITPIALPVYNVEILTRDIFGLPVNASANLRFSNGTLLSLNTGNEGDLVINDVPYGGAKGTVHDFVFTSSADASGGVPVRLIFITPFDLLVFLPVIVIALLIYVFASRKMHGQNKRRDDAGSEEGAGKDA